VNVSACLLRGRRRLTAKFVARADNQTTDACLPCSVNDDSCWVGLSTALEGRGLSLRSISDQRRSV